MTAHRSDQLRVFFLVATEAEENAGRTSNSVSLSRAGADHNTEHLWLDMQAGRAYELRGMCCADQGDFTRDFALAWQLREAPGTDRAAVPDGQDNCISTTNPDHPAWRCVVLCAGARGLPHCPGLPI